MGASFRYASVGSLETCRGCHCRGLSREQWVLQCMGEGEANGGDLMAWLWGQCGSGRTGGSAV
jgi:hypothetical protein